MNINTMKQETVVQTLKDAGCPEDFAARFLQVMECGSTAEQLRLLSCQRCKLLEQVHIEQKKLDCLDYLRYSLKSKSAKAASPRDENE